MLIAYAISWTAIMADVGNNWHRRLDTVILGGYGAPLPFPMVSLVLAASAKKSAFYCVLSVDADTKYGKTGKIAAASVAKSATGSFLAVNAGQLPGEAGWVWGRGRRGHPRPR